MSSHFFETPPVAALNSSMGFEDEQGRGAPGALIYLIDDDELSREMLRRVLEGTGHFVRDFGSAAELLAAVRRQPPALVISDIYMPVCDGFEVISALRHEHPSLPILTISGGGVLDAALTFRTAQLLGAHAVLAKPFCGGELLRRIRDCIVAPSSRG